jgi:hypothetical protein
LIIPFTYFFFKHKRKPSGNKQKYLKDYFWRTTLSSRFSSGVESKIAQDIKRIDLILEDKQPAYDTGVDISIEALVENGWFSTGNAYIKGMLCILAYKQPLSFGDKSLVNISNNWLKIATSKNYHHFFPKKYLRKRNEDEFAINHIANITIVDDFLNKHEIRAKAPSIYMRKFEKENPELEDTMKTHLIDNINEYGIWEDNYDVFFDKRLESFNRELKKRLIKTPKDSFESRN